MLSSLFSVHSPRGKCVAVQWFSDVARSHKRAKRFRVEAIDNQVVSTFRAVEYVMVLVDFASLYRALGYRVGTILNSSGEVLNHPWHV